MNKAKLFVQVVAVVLLAALLVCSVYATRQQGAAGSYTAVTTLTERSRQWITDTFGHCQSVVELMLSVNAFACRNFVYVDKFYVQHFDFDQFVFEDSFHGLCFDFACFMKCVALVWSEHRGLTDVRAYVACVDLPDSTQYHAYNFICDGDVTYYLDLTTDVSRTAAGKDPQLFFDIGDQTFAQYAESYREKIIALQ